METQINQKVVVCPLPSFMSETKPLEQINDELQKGYEVSDIVPYFQQSGGAIYVRDAGIYVTSVLFVLTQSDIKSSISYRVVRWDKDALTKVNNIIQEENAGGKGLLKMITLTGIIDASARQGIGKGTYGFGLFFSE